MDILRQGGVWTRLAMDACSGHMAAAYLFVGEPAAPRKDTALVFAQLLNCLRPIDASPCFACDNCRCISQGNFPDVTVINPEEKRAAIKIEDIRDMQYQINLSPYSGKKKVFIICGVEELTEAAANALLKTLEEPPQDAVIIMIAENVAEILPTVVSRCRVLKFDYQLAAGDDFLKPELLELMKIPGKWSGIWRLVDYLNNYERAELIKVVEELTWWYRDVLVYNIAPQARLLAHGARVNEIAAMASRIKSSACLEIISAVMQAEQRLRSNMNIKLVLAGLGQSLQEKGGLPR